MKITTQRLEKFGFNVRRDKHGFEVSQYTPAGEDWNLYFKKLNDIKDYAENYCPDDDFEMWVEARHNGIAGIPSIPELWQDQLWKRDILREVAGLN